MREVVAGTLAILCKYLLFLLISAGFSQAQAPPSLDDITLWITNTMAAEKTHKWVMSSNTQRVETFQNGNTIYHNTESWLTIRLTSVVIQKCDVTIIWEAPIYMKFTNQHTSGGDDLSGAQNDPFHREIRFNLADIQPSSISSYTRSEGRLAIPCNEQNNTKCQVNGIHFTAAADRIHDVYAADNIHQVNVPIVVPDDIPRLVRAFHDAAVACGGKDVNVNLY